MKKYLIKIALFFVAVAVVDILFGIACKYMNDHSKGGGIKSRYYVCKESTEDVLIFGSSRAKHHYVPDVVEDSLGMTCYNTGEDGNGIIFSYGILKMITQRYSPKLIIYDVTWFDMDKDDNMKYLDLLKPYYYELGIDSIFWSVNSQTKFMMTSSLYRYNTTCLRIFGNYLHPMTNYPKGYSALNRTMEYEPSINDDIVAEYDSLKLYYFNEFVKLAQRNNIPLLCCVSPYYKAPIGDDRYMPIKKICQLNDVPWLYFGSDSIISNNKMFFQDRRHLNDEGAHKYTSQLMFWIKNNYY